MIDSNRLPEDTPFISVRRSSNTKSFGLRTPKVNYCKLLLAERVFDPQ